MLAMNCDAGISVGKFSKAFEKKETSGLNTPLTTGSGGADSGLDSGGFSVSVFMLVSFAVASDFAVNAGGFLFDARPASPQRPAGQIFNVLPKLAVARRRL
jgi:hypothetical protein